MKRRIIGLGISLLLLSGVTLGGLFWYNDLRAHRMEAQANTLKDFESVLAEATKVNKNRIAEEKAQEEKARAEEEARIATEEAERKAAEEARLAAQKAAEEAAAARAAAAAKFAALRFATMQEAVDYWLNNYRHGAVGIEIFDLKRNTIVASYRSTATMYPRSIYKLFYVYDAYAQIDAGLDDPNSIYVGDRALGYCLDIMIRYSDNQCAEAMLGDSARLTRVGQLIRNLGLVSTQSNGLSSSAHDISLLLQHYYAHTEWSQASWQKFLDTALNQPYNYRKGLPSGFSAAAVVYDKAGWGGVAYNDAAIVEFPSVGASYIIVVMTENTAYSDIATLGKLIEKAVLGN